MINFIQNHPLLVIIVGIIIALLLVLAIVRVSSPKSKGKNSNTKQTNSPDSSKKNTDTKKEEKKKKEKGEKKQKEEKKVEQVYKTEKKEEKTEEEKKADDNKDEKSLLSTMAFVKTGKTISKLARREWIEKVPESEFTTEELIAIDSLIREKEIYDASKRTAHFNKSIRLSNFTKSGNYDDMFISHISDNVTQISAKRHLNINDAYMEKLYSRSYKALERSGVNQSYRDNGILPFDDDFEIHEDDLAEQLGDQREQFAYMIDSSYRDNPNTEIPDNEYMNDSIDLGPENILVVDSVMNRKNNKK